MAISDAQYSSLLIRLTRLEQSFNNLAVAMDRMVTLAQVQALMTVTQTEMADVRAIVEALQDRVTSIEEEPV